MFRILLLGPQGSGKGTQGELLAKKLGIPLISMGDLWRKEIENKTEWGKKYQAAYNQGLLAPDDWTSALAARRIQEPDAKDGFIFDGYPRNLAQKDLSDAFVKFTDAIVLRLSDEEAIKRLSGRRVCSKCGKNYHLDFNPPKASDSCDGDGAQLTVRSDDTPEAVGNRLAIYHAETEPLIDTYRERGILKEVDASKSIEEVHREIIKSLKH